MPDTFVDLARAINKRMGLGPSPQANLRFNDRVEVRAPLPLPTYPFPPEMDRLILGDEEKLGRGTHDKRRFTPLYSSEMPEGWDPDPELERFQEKYDIRPPMRDLFKYGNAISDDYYQVQHDFPQAMQLVSHIYPSPDMWGTNVAGSTRFGDSEIRLNPILGSSAYEGSNEGLRTIAHELAHQAQFANQIDPNQLLYTRRRYAYEDDPFELQANAVANDYLKRIRK
jgi:hypothetical protein